MTFSNNSHTSIISIHSLVKRETDFKIKLLFDLFYFNPLPRKEGDSAEALQFRF